MGKQCVVIAVLLPVLEDRRAGWIPGAADDARIGIDNLVLDVCEAFPKPNCAGLIREWARKIRTRISARYSGLVFRDRVAGDRMQNKRLGAACVAIESCNNLVDSRLPISRIDRKAWVEGIIIPPFRT